MRRTYKYWLIVAIVLTTAPFLIFLKDIPFGLLQTQPQLFWLQSAVIVGNVLGFIGTILMIWQVLLGVRYLSSFITADTVWPNKLHQWIGTYGVVFIIFHPLLEMYTYLEGLLWIFIPKISPLLELEITYGRLAFMTFLLIWVTSALLRGKMKYRPWLYIHYLVYPMLGLALFHAINIGSYLQKYVFLLALWYTFLTGFVLLCLYRLYKFSGGGKARYVVKSIEKLGQHNDVAIVTFQLESGEPLVPTIGQYMYVQLHRWGEAHPLSVMKYNKKLQRISICVRKLGKFTTNVHALQIGSTVFLDGPYGVFTQEGQNEKPKVVIAGGVGIAPFVRLIEEFGAHQTLLLVANRKKADVVLSREFHQKLGDCYFEFLSQESGSTHRQVIDSRITANYLKALVPEEWGDQTQYFICGSPQFTKALKKIVLSLGIPPARIHAEEFSM